MASVELDSRNRSPDPRLAGFHSVLFAGAASPVAQGVPAFLADLNLDQVCEALLADRSEYDLSGSFWGSLRSVDEIRYRQEVIGDLEREEVAGPIVEFGNGMRRMRECRGLARNLRDVHQRERWFVATVIAYHRAVSSLASALASIELRSRGLRGLRDYLAAYATSEGFLALAAEADELERELAGVHYDVLIRGLRVTVRDGEGEPDLSEIVAQTFAKFRQGEVKDHTVEFLNRIDTDPVEERVLAMVAELHPELFGRAAEFQRRRSDSFADDTLSRFDREVQFYLAYLEYIAPLRKQGLEFSLPEVSDTSRRLRADGAFDLALAHRLARDGGRVVPNDVRLDGDERVIVLSGPNQGGKTTFARMFGQLFHLAALGLPVPGANTAVFVPDRLFTHFEREEDLTTLRGKFEDELARMHAILEQATPASVLVMNESFGSTTAQDSLWVGERILTRVIDQRTLCLCVTFIDELSRLEPGVVSMISTVDPDDPAIRTFEIVRRPADGRAYALALARKHGICFDQIAERLKR